MAKVPEVTSHEIINRGYLRLNIVSDKQPCGFIDFIEDKVNFSVSCKRNFFKGMESIGNITCEYGKDSVHFVFTNKQQMAFLCGFKAIEEISNHIKRFGNSNKSQDIKNSLLND